MGIFVEEKKEDRGTVAKAGAFWAIIAAPLVLWRLLRRKPKSAPRKRFWRR
jgi:hypothetical protein